MANIDLISENISEYEDTINDNVISLRDNNLNSLELQIKAIHADKSILDINLSIYQKVESYIRTGKITTDDLLNVIRNNKNFLSSKVIKLLYENDIINDLSSTGINHDFLSMMLIQPRVVLCNGAPFSQITMAPCTEVYFWGMPSSGKTSALGAILGAITDGKIVKSCKFDPQCQGYGYMNRLVNLFETNGAVGTFPEGTLSTFEMGFILVDKDGGKHPITCIDLASELVRCMYKYNANEPLTHNQQRDLKTLTDILVDNRPNNRKIHFFVIEYGGQHRFYDGLSQEAYLNAALNYMESTGVFIRNADAIHILVTKVDKINEKGVALQDELRSFIKDNYHGFYKNLEKVCRDYDINCGTVLISPFSVGEVCMQDFFLYKDEYATAVAKVIIEESESSPPRFNRLSQMLRKIFIQ